LFCICVVGTFGSLWLTVDGSGLGHAESGFSPLLVLAFVWD
jgi:hypothetical protein